MPPTRSHRPLTKAARRTFWARREHTAVLAVATMDSDGEDDEEALDLFILAAIAHQQKRDAQDLKEGPRGPYKVPSNGEFLNRLIYDYTDRVFRRWLRMDRTSFWHVLELIQHDPVFRHRGRRPQRLVEHQLAVYLIRMGGELTGKTSDVTSVSDGILFTYCERVSKALRRIKRNHLAWPGERRRRFLKSAMAEKGFGGCIGIADGSLIRLVSKPTISGESYWCRKKMYAIAIQLVVDHQGRILDYELGWPGSTTDGTIFHESKIWKHRSEFFTNSEYLLVDKGYNLTQYTIRPFADHDITNDPDEAAARKRFNIRLSSLREAVEHTYGRLKGRFEVLRTMPGRDMDQIYKYVESLLVLHNILEELRDDPESIEGFNGAEDISVQHVRARRHRAQEAVEYCRSADNLYLTGVLRRKVLLQQMQDDEPGM